MNLSRLDLFVLYSLLAHGRSGGYPPLGPGKKRCIACGGPLPQFCGITCANFGLRTRGISTCQGAFHAKCYRQSADDSFPALRMKDLDDCLVDESDPHFEDEDRFRTARDGDDLMVPFQCDDCHFENITGRMPTQWSHRDALLLTCIRRATLDSFWSRERSTVASNLGQGFKYQGIMDTLGLGHRALRPKGPWPKEDVWGIKEACALLLRSKDKGEHADTIQFETMRQMRAFLSNYEHA